MMEGADGIAFVPPPTNLGPGQATSFALAQSAIGVIPNLNITTSRAGNAETIAIKTLAGNDPSIADPINIIFPGTASATNVIRTLTSALSITISSGSTLGFISGAYQRIWLVVFDDAGTLRLGVINCLKRTVGPPENCSICLLSEAKAADSTAEGGAGAADSAHVFYTGTAVTGKYYRILGFLRYALTTAGTWDAAPGWQPFGPGVALPRTPIQEQNNVDNTMTTITGTVTANDTLPSSTDGTLYLSQAITPMYPENVINARAYVNLANHSAAVSNVVFLTQDSSSAISATYSGQDTADYEHIYMIDYMLSAQSVSATTFKLRIGATSGTIYVNGQNNTRYFGGCIQSWLKVQELMA